MKNDRQSRLRPPADHPPSCGPAAVCALTGKPVSNVLSAIQVAAESQGRAIENWNSTKPADLVAALNSFGFSVFRKDRDVELKPRNIHNPIVSAEDWLTYPTIPEFLIANRSPDLLICTAYTVDLKGSHTFAVDGESFFDQNVGGVIVGPDGVHSDLAAFRVLTSYRVRDAAVDAETIAAINRRTDDVG